MSQEMQAVAPPKTGGMSVLVTNMAQAYGMEPLQFRASLFNLILAQDKSGRQPSEAEVMVCLAVANEHKLNPFTKEIHFFRDRTGQLRPVVGVDGWVKLANKQPMMDGFDQEFGSDEQGRYCRTLLHRKDWGKPVVHVEYLNEAKRPTDPWKNQPNRMLGHRSYIQAVRKAFGFAGVMDEDDYERMVEWQGRTVTVEASPGASPKPAARPRTLAEATVVLKAQTQPAAQEEPWPPAETPWGGETAPEGPVSEFGDEGGPQPEEEPGSLYGLPIAFQDAWETWCNEPIIKKADSTSPLKGHSWLTATQGGKDGKRHSSLKFGIDSAKKELADKGKAPSVWHQKAAITLNRLEQRLSAGDGLFPGSDARHED